MGDFSYGDTAGNDPPSPHNAKNDSAFQSQLDHLSQAQLHDGTLYGQAQSFNMGSMVHALPHSPHSPMSAHGHFRPSPGPGILPPHSMHQMQQQGYRVSRMDPIAIARAQQMQQAQYMYPQYNGLPTGPQSMPQMQLPAQYNTMDLYGFGGAPRSPHSVDPRYAQAGAFAMMPSASGESHHYARRASEPAPIPSFPRGPPRKPRQSGHALWVGNLPPAAQIGDLKDHFSLDATRDIESLFLISKSNCAFVNYRSEKACSDAMTRFHDSRFQGVRLVCRLRRNTATSSASGGTSPAPAVEEELEVGSSSGSPTKQQHLNIPQDPESPVIVSGSQNPSPIAEKPSTAKGSDQAAQRVPERYFVVKSLTVQDLESSTRTGIWATQNHNESLFNDAYQNADNVYLIFSANKSGEYFGYARMSSEITGQPVNLNARAASNEPSLMGTPHAIETPATTTAPKGRIIDDSSRGTIFWEAVHDEEDDTEQREKNKDEDGNESTPRVELGQAILDLLGVDDATSFLPHSWLAQPLEQQSGSEDREGRNRTRAEHGKEAGADVPPTGSRP